MLRILFLLKKIDSCAFISQNLGFVNIQKFVIKPLPLSSPTRWFIPTIAPFFYPIFAPPGLSLSSTLYFQPESYAFWVKISAISNAQLRSALLVSQRNFRYLWRNLIEQLIGHLMRRVKNVKIFI